MEQTIVRYLLVGFVVIVLLNLYWNLVLDIVELLTEVSKIKFLPEKFKLGTTLIGNLRKMSESVGCCLPWGRCFYLHWERCLSATG